MTKILLSSLNYLHTRHIIFKDIYILIIWVNHLPVGFCFIRTMQVTLSTSLLINYLWRIETRIILLAAYVCQGNIKSEYLKCWSQYVVYGYTYTYRYTHLPMCVCVLVDKYRFIINNLGPVDIGIYCTIHHISQKPSNQYICIRLRSGIGCFWLFYVVVISLSFWGVGRNDDSATVGIVNGSEH